MIYKKFIRFMSFPVNFLRFESGSRLDEIYENL